MKELFVFLRRPNETWEEALDKHDNRLSRDSLEKGSMRWLYPDEREELYTWAKQRKDLANHLESEVFIIPPGMSVYAAASEEIQKNLAEEHAENARKEAERDAELERMRMDSQHLSNNFKKGSGSSLSALELQVRKIWLMDETELEEILLGKAYACLEEELKQAVADRYLELQASKEDGIWKGVDAARRFL